MTVPSLSRRSALGLLAGTGGLASLGSVSRSSATVEQPTSIGLDVDSERIVGAFYYPWFGPSRHWSEGYVSDPTLGEYDSRSEALIDQHVSWARTNGINAFLTSWWGQDSWEDRTLKDFFLPVAGDEIQFSILYESNQYDFDQDGTVNFDRRSNRTTLASNLRYLEQTYFGHPNYLRIDGRPVVFFYVAKKFRGDVGGAFAEAQAALSEDIYSIADLVHWWPPTNWRRDLMMAFDAVSAYNMYKSLDDIDERFVERVTDIYTQWLLAANELGVDFIPSVVPGYDDTGVRPEAENPILPYDTDRFGELCERALNHTQPGLDAVFVTSFNEWHEDTQIEPGESYGTSALEVVSEHLANSEPEYVIEDFVSLTLAFSKTTKEHGDDTTVPPEDNRDLAIRCERMDLHTSDGQTISFDVGSSDREPVFVEGAYDPAQNDRRSWRWFGGTNGQTTMYLSRADLKQATRLSLHGLPFADGIEADVYVGSEQTDRVAFSRSGWHEYSISLQSATPSPTTIERQTSTPTSREYTTPGTNTTTSERETRSPTDTSQPGFGVLAGIAGVSLEVLRRQAQHRERD